MRVHKCMTCGVEVESEVRNGRVRCSSCRAINREHYQKIYRENYKRIGVKK